MNGVVKEGKEAIIYHANSGNDHDVAVKVFKRIQEFRQRGSYVDGDPRYPKQFSTYGKREQVELWSEKEFRNLTRANIAGVPVPMPLVCKKNVLFMRFLGEDGWPSPQLREIEIRHGSKKWIHLYCQTLVAVRRLYHCARLVHADLSEYNILLCPSRQVDKAIGVGDVISSKEDSLQVVLIDFGQSVDKTHPSADEFLARDISRINFFFENQGIKTLSNEEATAFIVTQCNYDTTNETINDSHSAKQNDSSPASDFEIVDYTPDTGTVLTNEEEDFVVIDKEHELNLDREEERLNKSERQRFTVPGWDDSKDYNKVQNMMLLQK